MLALPAVFALLFSSLLHLALNTPLALLHLR